MILLAIASALLFFITSGTGILCVYVLKKFLRIDFTPNLFETFLLGLVSSFIFFNLLSFIIPINFLTLIPLFLLSIAVFTNRENRERILVPAKHTMAVFFTKRNLLFVLPLIAVLFVYWIIPPLNSDSGEYHYIAIRWYEQYKVVPGLANVHGRLGFNPASFIISAAYSFTGLTGQALYPLNGILVLLFYGWLLKRILSNSQSVYNSIVLILAILMFRVTLINISSPSSDLLSGILLFYCGFRSYELIKAGKNEIRDYMPVLLISLFAVTAKLSAIPALLVIPFIYFFVIKKGKRATLVIKCIALACLIFVPWLIRNFLLSGYLLYPVPRTNLFNADWAVPHDVIQLDYLFSKYGPRTITVDFFSMQKMNMLQLTKVWFDYMLDSSLSSLLLTFAAFLSILSWLFFPITKKKIPANVFFLWCIYYIGVLIWFINSPEHRFGLPYLVLAIGLPWLAFATTAPIKWNIPFAAAPVLLAFCCLHYCLEPLKKEAFYSFSLRDCWLKPLRDRRYFHANDLKTFPRSSLGRRVKLYYGDDQHECLNADGPCMNWRYGQIEMRGNNIADGFRNTKDEVKKYFPFVDPQ